MKLSGVIERLEQVELTTGSPDAALTELKNALKVTTEIESYVAAKRAEILRSIGAHPGAFPEAAIAETSGKSLGAASKEKDRADTLGNADAVAEALADGAITTGHVDVLTRAARNLDDEATAALLGDDEALAEAAAASSSIAAFEKLVKRKAKALDTTDPEERFERQQRATRVRTWTDDEGMWNLKGRFDPDTGRKIAHQLGEQMRTKFAEQTPQTAPLDPLERRQYLEGLALAGLILEDVARSAGGAPIVVVDATQTDGAGGPVIDWGIPVELPTSVLFDIFATADPDVVIVSNGVVLHAPGRLDLGRTTRLASPAQRRALRALYSTCAVPGCSVPYNRTKLHHVVYWRDGGRTDLANLLPVCQHHHTKIHNDGWTVTLGPDRELTIRLANGQVLREERDKPSAA